MKSDFKKYLDHIVLTNKMFVGYWHCLLTKKKSKFFNIKLPEDRIIINDEKLKITTFILFQIYRLEGLKQLINQIGQNELKKFGNFDKSTEKFFLENEELKWDIELMFPEEFKNYSKCLINSLQNLNSSKLEKSIYKLEKQLSSLRFTSLDQIMNYGMTIQEFNMECLEIQEECYKFFEIDLSILDHLEDSFATIHNITQKIKEEIEMKFLNKSLKQINPFIIRVCFEDDQFTLSKDRIEEMISCVLASDFTIEIKGEAVNKISIIPINKKLFRPVDQYKIDEFIHEKIKIMLIFFKNESMNTDLKYKLKEYLKFKNITVHILSSLFPFLRKTRFLNEFFESFMQNYYEIRLIQKSSENSNGVFSSMVRYRKEMKIKKIFINTLQHKPSSFRTTVCVSGYLSQNCETTENSWKKLIPFFKKGNLLSVQWNSASSESVVRTLSSSLVSNAASSLLSLFSLSKFICDD